MEDKKKLWEKIKKQNKDINNNFLQIIVRELFYSSHLYTSDIEEILSEYKTNLRNIKYDKMTYEEFLNIFKDVDEFLRNHKTYFAYAGHDR